MKNAITETNFKFPKQTAFYKGKVRDVYSIGDVAKGHPL
jgi:phosphoribosylaminoimidazole-succinocarboxamide synthase